MTFVRTIIGLVLLAGMLAGRLVAGPSTNAPVFVPENPPAMQPLPFRHTPAYQAARHFLRGANLGNYLEVAPDSGGSVKVEASDFRQIKHEGFDHVRIPIGWQHYAGPAPDYKLSPEIFNRVDFAVGNALASGLAAMINIHHFDELDADPAGHTAEFLALWSQIARHYMRYPGQLAFELDNEPHQNATTAVMNPIYALAIHVIRQTNPQRLIVVEPGDWGNIDQLKNLVLPPDVNIMVSVHCYDPFYFTHQGASWTDGQTPVTGIQFPGPPDHALVPDPNLKLSPQIIKWIHRYNTLPTAENPSSPLAFAGKLRYVKEWSDYYRRPVHIGEFGAYTKADPESRARFYAAFREEAEKDHLGWAIWDWSAGFKYWDKEAGHPVPGMAEALFGKSH
jgi:endoglucanase